ncbi:3-keto-disaccharide hydrolase [Maribacter sp. IgM3_T14_3]|uniref:3-keto-disaccharide hydrolase n=1 Tax=Maribacter sp. IgM3_T14_3 TaxID=3415140 RepID=UPI003C6FB90C
MNTIKITLVFLFLVAFGSNAAHAQEGHPLEGKWNLTIDQEGEKLPSWLEIRHSGTNTLIGRFTYAFGSARPVAEIEKHGELFSFSIPPQWEPGASNMEFEGKIVGDGLAGTMIYVDGKTYKWTATKSPKLPYYENAKEGKTVKLFNGKNLSGWEMKTGNQWAVLDGILTSAKPGVNLISEEKFNDFKLHAEFRYPEGSNSGMYLRGRYEVQIADNIGLEPSSIYFGGIYGLLTPNENAAMKAGEWQTYDITLIGRRVTIVANGKTVISNQNIEAMTGGALDNNEAEAGPIMIQGDHGPVEFRKLEITPLSKG